MAQTILIGIGAGLAAALLFLAPIGGSGLAFPLFILTGLPIAIAGLGWGLTGGLIAAAAGSIVTAASLGAIIAAAILLLLFAAPIVWVTHLAGMSRPGDSGNPADVEWYPLGRLLLHTALAVGVGLIAVGIVTGYDPAIIAAEATRVIIEFASGADTSEPPPTAESVQPFIDIYVAILPFTMAMFMVVVVVFNVWLGAIVARRSGRPVRPAVPVWTVSPPNEIVIAFGIAVVLAFILPAPFGDMAAVVAGAFGCALALVGLAVMHALTRGTAGRGILLTVAYGFILFSGLPLILFAALGAAETFLQLRARRFGGALPPD